MSNGVEAIGKHLREELYHAVFSALKRMTTWLCVTIQKSDPSLGGGGTVLACQNCTTPTQRNTGEKPHDLVQGVMNYAADGLVFWMPQPGKKRELVGSVNAKWASISVPKTMQGCYLLHFESKLANHAQHYTGFSTNLAARIAAHEAGNSAKLVHAMTAAGIRFVVARLWIGADRTLEGVELRKLSPAAK